MELVTLLQQRKEAILQRALTETISRYPAEASGFIEKEGDRFQNPVGFTLQLGMKVTLDGILGDSDPYGLRSYLENIVRITAVQDFSPSDGLFFLTALRESLREEVGRLANKGDVSDSRSILAQWLQIEERIDAFFRTGFDLYMESREKVYQIRLEEMRSAYSYVRYNKR